MLTVYKDSRDLLWIGHPHGLSIWNQKNDSIYFLDQKNGLAANLVRAVTEDNNNQIVGIVSYRALLRLIAGGWRPGLAEPVPVSEVMRRDPVSVTPETSTLVRSHSTHCPPV